MRHYYTLSYPLHNSQIESSSIMKGLIDSAMNSFDFTLKMEYLKPTSKKSMCLNNNNEK